MQCFCVMTVLLYGHIIADSRTTLIITHSFHYYLAILASHVCCLEASYI